MTVNWKDPADAQRLRELIEGETHAKQRNRYRALLIAGEGCGPTPELDREQIATTVGRSRNFVDSWVGRDRLGGIDALRAKRQPGAIPKLAAQQQQQLCAMLDAGPTPEEGPLGVQLNAFQHSGIRSLEFT